MEDPKSVVNNEGDIVKAEVAGKEADLNENKIQVQPTKNDDNDVQNSHVELKVPPAAPTVRQDFYQTESDVVLSLLAKNVNPKDVHVTFNEDTLEVKTKLADGQDYALNMNLFGTVRPNVCSYIVTKSKIEIKLRKDTAGLWSSLEKVAKDDKKATAAPSRTTKDWSKVEKEVEKELKDYDDGNPFAAFYDMADDDAKRAMMKSMQESHGTVLNMNWQEVGKKKINPYESEKDKDDDDD